MSFEKPVSLGGHLAKAHPGVSKPYNHKMQIRKKREEQRKYLKLAKEWYDENISSEVKIRSYITKIKKAMMAGQPLNKNNFMPKVSTRNRTK